MDEHLGRRLTRRLARLLLLLYPQAFRRRWADDFVEAAAHRCDRELAQAAGLGTVATVRTWVLLCADTLGAAPVRAVVHDHRRALRRDAPTAADYRHILRGSKGPIEDAEPAKLYSRACELGWLGSCQS